MIATIKIEKVIESGVLTRELLVIPAGAKADQIQDEQIALGCSLSKDLIRFFSKWNRINLEVVSIFGCQETHPEIPAFRDRQSLLSSTHLNGVVIGSDPSGFIYIEMSDGSIVSSDTESIEQQRVGDSFDDFFCRYVFGKDADLFAGEDWKQDLQQAGLLQ